MTYDAKFCNKCGAPVPKVCSQCGAVLALGAKFCSACGTAVPSDVWANANICLKCNSLLRPGAKFCMVCGAPREQPKVEVKPENPLTEEARADDGSR